ncbi:MAG: hypothetical protein AAB371_01010 [Patescibacteria group bacterium]
MTRQEVLIVIFILILIVGNIFFGGQYFSISNKMTAIKRSAEIQKTNEKALNFGKLFIDTVLRSENEIGFETRLRLENAVRETGNKEILSAWQKFIDSKTEVEAQKSVKDLLEVLIDNIQVD